MLIARRCQGRQPDDPSPAEIVTACLAIQQEWTDEERRLRMRVDLRPRRVRIRGTESLPVVPHDEIRDVARKVTGKA
jgi:hypothetical protein